MDAIFLSSVVPKSMSTLMRPMGAYQIAWYLRKHGYDVQVLEFLFRLSEEEILKLIHQFVTPKTKVIGLGMMINMPQLAMGVVIKKFEAVLQKCKNRYPWVKIIVGGPAGPTWSRRWRNKTLFDYVLTGHGEDTALGLMNHLARGAPHPQFILNDGNRFIKESFEMPHGKLFNIEDDDHMWHDADCIQPGESLPLELGRGCIFKCKFCRYPYIGKHKNDFSRNMECVKNELLDNYSRWGVTNYYMLDDTFNADQERLTSFWKMTQELPFKIQYSTYIRADLLAAHPDSQYMVQESGMVGCFFGIESFTPEAATMIGKPWSPKAKEFIPRLHNDVWKKQINFRLGFIVGLIPETLEDLQQTNRWCIDNDIPSWAWAPLNINRDAHDEFKSEFDLNAEKYGFEWITENGRPMWKSPQATLKIAKEWETILTEEAKPHQQVSAWNILELPQFGIEIDSFRTIKQIDMPWAEINVKRTAWLNNYFAQVKSLPSPSKD